MKVGLGATMSVMATAAKRIPEGFHTVTPYLVVQGAAELIEFLKQVFDAAETSRNERPDGSIAHATVQIGDSVIMLGDSPDASRGETAMLYVYVDDVDAVYQRGLDAGATSISAPADQPYGDRNGAVKDRFGNSWWMAVHIA